MSKKHKDQTVHQLNLIIEEKNKEIEQLKKCFALVSSICTEQSK